MGRRKPFRPWWAGKDVIFKNPLHERFARGMRGAGFRLTSQGLPRFYVENEKGQRAAVWLMPSPHMQLGVAEAHVCEVLLGAGMACYSWSELGGLKRLKKEGGSSGQRA